MRKTPSPKNPTAPQPPKAHCKLCDRSADRRYVKKTGEWTKPSRWVVYQKTGDLFCEKCGPMAVITRTITLPVAKPLDCDWEQLKRAVIAGWTASTIVKNELMRELLKHEVRVKPNTVYKSRTMVPGTQPLEDYPAEIEGCHPSTHLYRVARELAPELASGDCSVLAKEVWSFYGRHRAKVLVNGELFPSFRYPQPFVVRAQESNPRMEIAERRTKCKDAKGEEREVVYRYAVVGLKINDTVYRLALASGKRHKRAMSLLKQAIKAYETNDPNFKIGDISIAGEKCGWAAHRYALAERDPHTRNKTYARILVRIPITRLATGLKEERRKEPFVLKTAKTALMVGQVEEGFVFTTDGHDLRRRLKANERQMSDRCLIRKIRRHERIMRRTAKDRKMGFSRRIRHEINAVRSKISDKHERWMKAWMHHQTARVIAFAKRQNVGVLEYDDTDKSFLDHFQWFRLRDMLKNKCHESGIIFVYKGTDLAESDPVNGAAKSSPVTDPEEDEHKAELQPKLRSARAKLRNEQRTNETGTLNGVRTHYKAITEMSGLKHALKNGKAKS